jgi:hypothetical protein
MSTSALSFLSSISLSPLPSNEKQSNRKNNKALAIRKTSLLLTYYICTFRHELWKGPIPKNSIPLNLYLKMYSQANFNCYVYDYVLE